MLKRCVENLELEKAGVRSDAARERFEEATSPATPSSGSSRRVSIRNASNGCSRSKSEQALSMEGHTMSTSTCSKNGVRSNSAFKRPHILK